MGNREANRVRDLVSNHMRFMNVMKMRPARLKRFLREDYFGELLKLHQADCKASHGNLVTYRFCLEKLAQYEVEEEAAGLRPPPLLDGHALAGMGFTPGPIFKEILDALEDEQLEGRVRTRPEAQAFVEKKFRGRLRGRGGETDSCAEVPLPRPGGPPWPPRRAHRPARAGAPAL